MDKTKLDDVVAEFVRKHPEGPLAIAWSMGSDAAVFASIAAQDSSSVCITAKFTTSVLGKKVPEKHIIKVSGKKALEELMQLHYKASFVRFPLNIAGILTILLWIALVAVALNLDLDYSDPFSAFIKGIEYFSLFVIRSPTIAEYSILIMLIAHVVEALYVVHSLMKFKWRDEAILSWVPLVVFFGIAVTQKVQILNGLTAGDKKNTKSEKKKK